MAQVLRHLPPVIDPAVVVGIEHGDDAAVYRLGSGENIVATLDFFTPVVDDPFDFGRIAAANSLSDVYAMGGTPLFALSVVCWPVKLGMEPLGRILAGGAAVATAAGIPILGGHSVDDSVPKFGLVVIGRVDADKLCTNSAAQAGDLIYLTKPLGSGALTGALKKDLLPPEQASEVIAVMAALNTPGAKAMNAAGVRAATDITGFGLLGHLHKMMLASGTAADIDVAAVPLIAGAAALYAAGTVPGGTKRNLAYYGEHASFSATLGADAGLLVADAQTSGGILACVPPAGVAAFERSLRAQGALVACIGRVAACTKTRLAGQCSFR